MVRIGGVLTAPAPGEDLARPGLAGRDEHDRHGDRERPDDDMVASDAPDRIVERGEEEVRHDVERHHEVPALRREQGHLGDEGQVRAGGGVELEA